MRLLTRGTGGEPADGSSEAPSISADGRYVAFSSSARNLAAQDPGPKWSVFVQDTQTGVTALVSRSAEPANGHSRGARISGNGGFIAFQSEADNLVAGDDNGVSDVFVVKNPLSP